jgi:hypothetical protein
MAYEKAHPLGGLSWYLYSIYIVSLGGLLARHIARTHACRVLHPVLVAGGRAASAGISRRTSWPLVPVHALLPPVRWRPG